MRFANSRIVRLFLSVWLPLATLGSSLHHNHVCHTACHSASACSVHQAACADHGGDGICSWPAGCSDWKPHDKRQKDSRGDSNRRVSAVGNIVAADEHDPAHCVICRFLSNPPNPIQSQCQVLSRATCMLYRLEAVPRVGFSIINSLKIRGPPLSLLVAD
jgi:hypothetical protein